MKTQQSTVIHPLDGKKVFSIQSWSEWKERWEKESCFEILHSLLHFGFSIPPYCEESDADRLCMYLEIADQKEKYPDERSKKNLLAQKAFQMLCQNFFKNTAEVCYLPSWAGMISFPGILDKIFWFFRQENQEIFNLGYGRDPRQKEIARNFARDFCLHIWNNDAFREYHPAAINLLAGLGELNLFFETDRFKGLDKDCIKIIEDYCLKSKLHLPSTKNFGNDFRPPTTVEEACLGGSQAAKFLLILRVIKAEEKRFDQLKELEIKRLKVEKEIKKLQA